MVLLSQRCRLGKDSLGLGRVIPPPLAHLCGKIETPLDRFNDILAESNQLTLDGYRDLLELVSDLALDRERRHRDRRQFALKVCNSLTEAPSVIRAEIEFSRQPFLVPRRIINLRLRHFTTIQVCWLAPTRKRILCLLRRGFAGAIAQILEEPIIPACGLLDRLLGLCEQPSSFINQAHVAPPV